MVVAMLSHACKAFSAMCAYRIRDQGMLRQACASPISKFLFYRILQNEPPHEKNE